MKNKKVKKCKNSWEDRNERAENLNLNQICGNFKLLNDPVQGEASVFASDPSKVENSSVAGVSLGISVDGCRMPNKPLRISMHGCRIPFDSCFQRKLMGAVRPFSKSMGAIAPIDPP